MNLANCHFSSFVHFFGVIGLRPYYNNIGEEDNMCGGSPLIRIVFFLFVSGVHMFCVGEIHRGGIIYTLVLPSVMGLFFVVVCLSRFRWRGDSQGRRYIYSRSPLFEPDLFFVLCSHFCSRCRGDSHGAEILILSFSPLWTEILSIFEGVHFSVFWGLSFIRACWWGAYYHRGGWPPILYIYSLRHFLTTKGALIDGDGYPPKNPQNGSKKGDKLIKNHSNLMSKIDQKTRFLM